MRGPTPSRAPIGSSAAGQPATPMRTSRRGRSGDPGTDGCAETRAGAEEESARMITSTRASRHADIAFLYVEPRMRATRFDVNGARRRGTELAQLRNPERAVGRSRTEVRQRDEKQRKCGDLTLTTEARNLDFLFSSRLYSVSREWSSASGSQGS